MAMMERLTKEQQELVLKNRKLVYYVMKTYFPSYIPNTDDYNDLAQQGFFGLCLAAVRYDDSKSKFSSYAVNYIWGMIQRYMNERSSWSFHYRKGTKYEHIPLLELNRSIIEKDHGEEIPYIEAIPDNADDYEYSELCVDLLAVFQKASPKHGALIFALLMEENTHAAIASVIGVSTSRVSRIVQKAKTIYDRTKTRKES